LRAAGVSNAKGLPVLARAAVSMALSAARCAARCGVGPVAQQGVNRGGHLDLNRAGPGARDQRVANRDQQSRGGSIQKKAFAAAASPPDSALNPMSAARPSSMWRRSSSIILIFSSSRNLILDRCRFVLATFTKIWDRGRGLVNNHFIADPKNKPFHHDGLAIGHLGGWAPKLFPYMGMLGFSAGQQALVGSCWGIASVVGIFFSISLPTATSRLNAFWRPAT
jgi:hypothetical protein